MEINHLTHKVIGCAYKVHNVLGPGFLEKVYENSLKLELRRLGIDVRQQGKLPVLYEGHQVGVYYPDLWIDGAVDNRDQGSCYARSRARDEAHPLSHCHWNR